MDTPQVELEAVPATRKQNYPAKIRNSESLELSANESKFISELQKDPTSITRAARLAFPDHKDPSQKGWQMLENERVYRAYSKAMKVWNKILNVPKILKNLDESLNAMRQIVHDGQIVSEVPDHQARNVARAQALNILGILDKNKLLDRDGVDGAPVQIVVMGQVYLASGKPLEVKVGD